MTELQRFTFTNVTHWQDTSLPNDDYTKMMKIMTVRLDLQCKEALIYQYFSYLQCFFVRDEDNRFLHSIPPIMTTLPALTFRKITVYENVSPLSGLHPLKTARHGKADTHPRIEWDSNPLSQY